MTLRRTLGAAAALLACLASTPSPAAETVRKTDDMLSSVAGIAKNLELADVPSPIEIAADRLEFDYERGLLRYEGNVSVNHAGVRIRASSLDLSFKPEGKRSLRKITARGSVEVTRGDETAHGELAEYDPSAGTIVLSQNARLGSGPNSLSGDKVVVYLDEGRATVTGGAKPAASDQEGTPAEGAPGRVRVVIMPDALPGKDGKTP